MSAQKRRKRTKKRKQVDWEEEGDRAYSRELKRHRRTTTEIKTISDRATPPETFEPNGVVISHTKKYAFVLYKGEETQCQIDEAVIESGATLLAPGDRVLVEEFEDMPLVRAIAPRTSKLSRPAVEGSRVGEQIIAANVDVLVIVVTVKQPKFKPGLVDRYLILADLGDVEPVICLNKCDLTQDEPDTFDYYRDLDIPIVHTSATEAIGIDALKALLAGKLAVLAGQSGVGKSSLLNAISPPLDLETRTVSDATEKGRHTTTASRLYELDADTRIIDTPGIRQLGLHAIHEDELPFYFPELADRGQDCKFRNCTHTHEPDCAVLAAVEAGSIPARRYKSYRRIRDSIAETKSHR